jgi:hypothetical protein
MLGPVMPAAASGIGDIQQGICDNDGICEAGETLACGDCSCNNDDLCEVGLESSASCPADCYCGDEICNINDDESLLTCAADCDFCGDGICEYPYLEDPDTCPQDCLFFPTPTPTSTLRPTSTPTPTATPTITPTPTRLPPTATPTSTLRPTPLPTLSVEEILEIPAGCSLVSYESQSTSWQGAYSSVASIDYSIPQRSDDREVYVCEEPPLGRLCFLLYEGILSAADGNVARIALVDCVGDECTQLARVGQVVGEQICYEIQSRDDIDCGEGCALILRDRPIEENTTGVSGLVIVIVSVGGLILIIVAIIIILLLTRRRREEEEEQI